MSLLYNYIAQIAGKASYIVVYYWHSITEWKLILHVIRTIREDEYRDYLQVHVKKNHLHSVHAVDIGRWLCRA